MSDKIIQELHQLADNHAASGFAPVHPDTLRKFAAHINALTYQVDKYMERLEDEAQYSGRLNAELSALKAANDTFAKRQVRWNDRMVKLQVENAMLRSLVQELNEHEGAEGWSEGLRERIDAVMKVNG